MEAWSQFYKYDDGTVLRVVPTRAGLYRLCFSGSDGKYYVFYIGQSDNLERRLLEHLQVSEPNTCLKEHLRRHSCVFQYVEVPTQRERDALESSEIAKYSPSCNDRR